MSTTTEVHRLWQLISPLLPVGAFQYSQGLANAVETGAVRDEVSACEWISGLLGHVVASVDLPIVERVRSAWQYRDEPAVFRWDALQRACRETMELRREDAAMGRALSALARELDEPFPQRDLGFASAWAVCSTNASIETEAALQGFAWAWAENQTAIAVRCIPLGHASGQRMLRRLAGELGAAVGQALATSDEHIGRTAPCAVLASMRHETQHTRLFMS